MGLYTYRERELGLLKRINWNEALLLPRIVARVANNVSGLRGGEEDKLQEFEKVVSKVVDELIEEKKKVENIRGNKKIKFGKKKKDVGSIKVTIPQAWNPQIYWPVRRK